MGKMLTTLLKKQRISKPVLFFLMLTLPLAVQAQNRQPAAVTVTNSKGEAAFSYLVNTPDPDMKKIPTSVTTQRQKNPAEFIRLLAEYINEKSESDFERVKKAHDWVALNIKYDTQSYFSGRFSSQDFDAVIKRGNAVCAGYSDVFKYLCDALEIECIIVEGHARWNIGDEIYKYDDVMISNHAWNIVTIDGEKYLIDTTWDSGYLQGRNFEVRYKTDYFFADPAIFIYNHFSYDASTQLLDPPVSAEEFDNLPFISPLFFHAFETWPNLARITEIIPGDNITVDKNTLDFSLKEGYELSYCWCTSRGAQIGSRYFPAKREAYNISIPKLNPGKHFLRVSVRKAGERLYWDCAEFGFVVIDG